MLGNCYDPLPKRTVLYLYTLLLPILKAIKTLKIWRGCLYCPNLRMKDIAKTKFYIYHLLECCVNKIFSSKYDSDI